MAQLLIRDIEDGVLVALRERARRSGQTLEQSVHGILCAAAAADKAGLVARLDRIRAQTPPVRPGEHRPEGWELIRDDRDSR